MKSVVQNATYGEIVYKESFWTGEKEVFINSKKLEKVNKTTFCYDKGETKETVSLSGSFMKMKGIILVIGGESIVLVPFTKWYEIVLAILPFLPAMIWCNSSAALREFVPVFKYAAVGVICGVFGVLSFLLIKTAGKLWQKLLVGLAMIAATFLVCFVVAIGIIAALA